MAKNSKVSYPEKEEEIHIPLMEGIDNHYEGAGANLIPLPSEILELHKSSSNTDTELVLGYVLESKGESEDEVLWTKVLVPFKNKYEVGIIRNPPFLMAVGTVITCSVEEKQIKNKKILSIENIAIMQPRSEITHLFAHIIDESNYIVNNVKEIYFADLAKMYINNPTEISKFLEKANIKNIIGRNAEGKIYIECGEL